MLKKAAKYTSLSFLLGQLKRTYNQNKRTINYLKNSSQNVLDSYKIVEQEEQEAISSVKELKQEVSIFLQSKKSFLAHGLIYAMVFMLVLVNIVLNSNLDGVGLFGNIVFLMILMTLMSKSLYQYFLASNQLACLQELLKKAELSRRKLRSKERV